MKYKLTDETKVIFGRTLHQIVCVTAFANVAAGEAGGWIESEKNLDQDGDAWVYGNAEVYGDAKVYGDAWVYGNAEVYGDAKVYGDAVVCGDAWVCGDADYIVLKNNWSSGRYFTYTLSNKKWKVGCFYGASEELIKKAYKDSEISGKCYEASVRYVEQLLNIQREVK
jgi:hypothetical protein